MNPDHLLLTSALTLFQATQTPWEDATPCAAYHSVWPPATAMESSPWDGQTTSHPPGEAGQGEDPSEGFGNADLQFVAPAGNVIRNGLVGGTGLEQTALPGSQTQVRSEGAAECAALGGDSASAGSDLARVMAAWPHLPQATRQRILALARIQNHATDEEGAHP